MQGSPVQAVLGPTNTGKTHRAVERMLEHDVRDDRAAAAAARARGLRPHHRARRRGARRARDRRGEARPAAARLLGLHGRGDADRSRGRLPRGRRDPARRARRSAGTCSPSACSTRAGAARRGSSAPTRCGRSSRELVPDGADRRAPAPLAARVRRARRSSRELPPRSAVVAFSMPQVYELAERLRALRGGAAVVLGALSPRTRNAQVAMFQAGEVDYLVATDAIGMGLNLDVEHVAFAALRKFDGREVRELDAAELAQIAGRAGRYIDDGTFGTLAPLGFPRGRRERDRGASLPAGPPPASGATAISTSSSIDALARLAAGARRARRALRLARARRGPAALARARAAIRASARARAATRPSAALGRLPRPRLSASSSSSRTSRCSREIFAQLSGRGRARSRLDRRDASREIDDPDGDIETLIARIASIRTWTYVSHRGPGSTIAARVAGADARDRGSAERRAPRAARAALRRKKRARAARCRTNRYRSPNRRRPPKSGRRTRLPLSRSYRRFKIDKGRARGGLGDRRGAVGGEGRGRAPRGALFGRGGARRVRGQDARAARAGPHIAPAGRAARRNGRARGGRADAHPAQARRILAGSRGGAARAAPKRVREKAGRGGARDRLSARAGPRDGARDGARRRKSGSSRRRTATNSRRRGSSSASAWCGCPRSCGKARWIGARRSSGRSRSREGRPPRRWPRRSRCPWIARSRPISTRVVGYPAFGPRAVRADVAEKVAAALGLAKETPPAAGQLASWLGCSAKEATRVASRIAPPGEAAEDHEIRPL